MKRREQGVKCGVLVVALSGAAAVFAEPAEEELFIKPGSFTGCIVLVNQQKRLSAKDVAEVAAFFAKETECNVMVAEKGDGAQIVLTVIDDAKEPKMLVASEDHWGKVNVAKLVDDLPGEGARKKFFASRGRKLIIKALSLLCGGGGSSFEGNIMNAVTVRDFDGFKEQLPMDMLDKYDRYLKRVGVTKKQAATYAEACAEGWAPSPKNDVQKKIWDEVHTIPSKPIKIEYNEKRDKGK